MAEPGEVINGRYALRTRIASGATADVYLGDDLRLGREVAVKVLSAEQARERRGIERFRQEAQAAAALSHPNIVAVYDWGVADETAFLVMQYVAGPDLRSVLRKRGRLAEREALQVAADITAALAVAHRRRIVHRDVKPRNVLLDRRGSALLADFGIAASTNGVSEREGVYGTALYVSPEQAQGLTVDGRGDLYSLGAMLYELLTGQPPFRGTTAADVARQHISAAVVRPRAVRAEISAAAEAIVMRALEKDPSRRFSSATEMHAALIAAARDSSAGADTDPPRVPARPQAEALSAPGPRNAGTGAHSEAAARTRIEPLAAAGTTNGATGTGATGHETGNWDSRQAVRHTAPTAVRRWMLLAAPLLVLALLALVRLPTLAKATTRQVPVPNIAGQHLQDAQAAIEAAGLTLSTEEQVTQDTPAGVVVTQDPLPDRPTAGGSSVHAVVSSGISVPDLSGQQCAEARAAQAQTGWTVKPVRWRVANAPDFGKVVAQDPAPGAVVDQKGQISVQVAGPMRPC